MRIGWVTSNPTFGGPIMQELDRRGHDVIVYRHTESVEHNAFQLGQMLPQCERVFVDWAQPPLEAILQNFDTDNVPVFVRAHRIEMYADEYIKQVPWEKVACLFFVGQHVEDRFGKKWQAPPQRVVNLGHVGIDAKQWTIDAAARKFEPPYKIVLAGNIVPKKRVYTAVQLVADLGEDFHLAIYGNGGQAGYGNHEYHINVQDLIEGLGIERRVECGGSLPQDQLRDVFQRSHFVLSASNEEGCHTSIAEGMACGCVPLVNCWRGAADVYPAEWVWQTPKGFYALIDKWLAEPDKGALAETMRAAVLPRYDAQLLAEKACDIITGPLTAQTVGEWYSTGDQLRHMIDQDGNGRQVDALNAVRGWLPEGGSIMELGCGTGYISRTLAQEGHRAVGIDVAGGLLEFAAANNPGGAEFHQADVTRTIGQGPFDVITLIDCLEHIRAPHHEDLILRAASQLAEGGYLVIRFPWQERDRQIIEERVFPKIVRRYCANALLNVVQYTPLGREYFEIVARKGVA